MFDLGIQEMVVIFVIALIVYGPKDLPELGRKVGRYVAMFKRMINDVKHQMDTELYEYTDPIKKEIQQINKEAMESIKPPAPEKPAQTSDEHAVDEHAVKEPQAPHPEPADKAGVNTDEAARGK